MTAPRPSRAHRLSTRARAGRYVACCGALLATLVGCRLRDEVARIHTDRSDAARHVLAVDFTLQITPPDNFVLRPDEFGSVGLDPTRPVVYVGSREGTVLAVTVDRGDVAWEVTLGGAVSSPPVVASTEEGDLLLVGTDNGTLVAIDLATHKPKWEYETPGRVRNAPRIHEGVAYFVNSRDQVFALDLRGGHWRWQYEHDFSSDFTVHGHGGLTILARDDGDETGTVFACFDDGKVVALGASSGEPLWIANVAPDEAGPFSDCDATPWVDHERHEVLVSGQSTGVAALSLDEGTTRWTLPMHGGGSVVPGPGSVRLVASSLEGLYAFSGEGHMRWRTTIDPGVLSDPVLVDRTVFLTHSEIGLLALDVEDGDVLAQMRTGSGMSGAPTLDLARQRLYVLSNRGMLWSLRVGSATDDPFGHEKAELTAMAR